MKPGLFLEYDTCIRTNVPKGSLVYERRSPDVKRSFGFKVDSHAEGYTCACKTER